MAIPRDDYDTPWQESLDEYFFIDWMMRLPDDLARAWIAQVAQLETERNMQYVVPMTPSLADLAARFPLERVMLPIGDRAWQITCVTDQDALLDGVNEVEHVPYGFLLWESAVALAAWLAERPNAIAGKRVLELGAGVGLAGLMAQHLGAAVWQTDHRADVLLLAQENARQNGVALPQQFIADWRAWQHTVQYDLILGADILYERAMHRHLAPIFATNLAPGGTLVLSDPSRPQALELIAKLEDEGWQVAIEMRTITLPLPGRANKATDVALLTCQKPIMEGKQIIR